MLPQPQRRRGRPRHAQTRLLAIQPLGRHHFAFVRALLEGLDPRSAHTRYLAFAGQPSDLRQIHTQLKKLTRAIEQGGQAIGMSTLADRAGSVIRRLPGIKRRRPKLVTDTRKCVTTHDLERPVSAMARPTLDQWIQEQPDPDFFTVAEWAQQYEAEFPAPAPQPKVPAAEFAEFADAQDALDEEGALTHQQRQAAIAALIDLEKALSQEPSLDDALQRWFACGLNERLAGAELLTLRDLVQFVNVHGHRWHRHVAGLGATRAKRIVAWLSGPAAKAGAPLSEQGRHSAVELQARRPLQGGASEARNEDGRTVAAIEQWLRGYCGKTRYDYSHAAEHLLRWCRDQRLKPLSDLDQDDVRAYRSFLADPHVHPEGGPLRRPLGLNSQRRELAILSSLWRSLVQQGIVRTNVVARIGVKVNPGAIVARTSFDGKQWTFVQRVLDAEPDTPSSRRLRLVLQLGRTTGMSLTEITSAKVMTVKQEIVDGKPAWVLGISAPGQESPILVMDEVKTLIDLHHADVAACGGGPNSEEAADSFATPRSEGRPLIGRLREPPPRLVADRPASIARTTTAVERSALYQSLKRFFRRVAKEAQMHDDAPSPGTFLAAASPWLCNASEVGNV